MTWKKHDIPITLEPEKIEVAFHALLTIGDTTYGAARVSLRLGHSRALPCFALRAGVDRRILPEADAEAWLLEHHFPSHLIPGLLAWADDWTEEEEED